MFSTPTTLEFGKDVVATILRQIHKARSQRNPQRTHSESIVYPLEGVRKSISLRGG
ncbi:MAG: hypothetical protein HXS54_18725 [Theionarchaea archaeon]|nr:hypothetical protein [Theionarchaea archaeon]